MSDAPVTSMQWNGEARSIYVQPGSNSAQDIVAWVNANGGEARYEPGMPTDPLPSGFEVKQTEPRIAVRTRNGWAYAKQGDTIRMGEAGFIAKDRPVRIAGTNRYEPDILREFTVESA